MKLRFANNKRRTKHLVITAIAAVSFLLICSFTQHTPSFLVQFKVSIQKGDFKNASITFTKNGQPDGHLDSISHGNTVDLDFNSTYVFTCTKPGYITKSILFDTKIPSGRERNPFAKFNCDVHLTPQPKDSIITYNAPIGKIKFNIAMNDFDFDKAYSKTVKTTRVLKAEAQ